MPPPTEPAPRPEGRIDALLKPHREALGADHDAYRGHAQRVFHFTILLSASSPEAESREILAIAAAYHDLAIWTVGTLDYLRPSERLAEEALHRQGLEAQIPAARAVIENHHKLTPYRGPHARLAEPFRRADLADLSWGLLGQGLSRRQIRAVYAAFPAAGFHGRITRLVLGWAVRHPLRPLPMMRW